MKALVYTAPEALAFRDVPDPVPAEGDELVRIDSVGICGSDMHAFLGHDDRRPAPLVLGHEGAGTISGGPRDGERVTINPLVTCMRCPACLSGRENLCADRQIISMPPREGAFAQYVAMPARNLVTVPDHVSFEQAALAEPIACGWHAVRLARAVLGDGAARALVIGGGPIGVGAAFSLHAQGITDVTLVEPNPLRRDYMSGMPFAVTTAEALTDAAFDLVIDGVGYDATRALASARVRPGGVIAHIGLGGGAGGFDVRRITLQEITVIGTYTYSAQDFRDTAASIFDGRLGALDWIECRPLSEGARAFDDIRAGRVAAPKLILKPW